LVLLSLKKSYIGNKKDGIKTGRPAIDLKSRESNELNIHCLEHGQRESFFMTGDLKAAETTVTAVTAVVAYYGAYRVSDYFWNRTTENENEKVKGKFSVSWLPSWVLVNMSGAASS
jgi:hypothetical protein